MFADAAISSVNELRKSEERFRRVIQAAPNGILVVDRTGKIVLCNPQLEEQFQYKSEELVGQKLEILLPERFRRNHPGQRDSFFMSPVPRQMGAGRDLFGLKKDGTEFPVEVGLSPLITDEGSFVLATVVDITKRKILEERVRQSTEAIRQKNEEMEQFVYTVSHDLKSPLVTASGFLGILKEDLQAGRLDQLPDSVDRLDRANRRMSQLIDDLLQLSRAGRLKLEIQRVDTLNVVKTIIENLSKQLLERGIAVEVPPSLPSVEADHNRLYQVFENLIINAMKYGCPTEGSRIQIGFEDFPSETRFFVRDFGPGIAREYQTKIFGLFQRLEAGSKGGTGVGLAIVARAMQLHGGRAWVESQLGQGATFWIAIPKNPVVGDGHD